MAGAPESAPPLPGVLGRIAEVAGADAALAIWRRFGGRDLYIPMAADPATLLARGVGMPAAEPIVAALGHGAVAPPAMRDGPYDRMLRELSDEIDRLDRAGHSAAQIAARTGVTERTVRNRRRRRRAAPASPGPVRDLFG